MADVAVRDPGMGVEAREVRGAWATEGQALEGLVGGEDGKEARVKCVVFKGI